MRAFVSGSTGYIGSRLIPTLLQAGHQVVAGMREEKRAQRFAWADGVEPRHFDIEEPESARTAVAGCDVAYFLVHSMNEEGYRERDANGARNFAEACNDAGVQRIIYLSGIIPEGQLSEHLASRLEVENIFLSSHVPTTVLRAAIILGAGSTSFEIIRLLVEKLLVLPIPSWMRHSVQPVATDDVTDALVRVGEGDGPDGHVDLGGPSALVYPALIHLVSDELGKRRTLLPIPGLPHGLVGFAVGIITGIPRRTVTELVKSLKQDMVCHEPSITGPIGLREAVRRAISSKKSGTRVGGDRQTLAPTDPDWAGGEEG